MKRILVPMTAIGLMVLLGACSSGKTPVATTSETEAAMTVSVKEDKETETETVAETRELRGENALKEALRQRLDSTLRIHGTAGASLKTIHQAVHFLQLADAGDFTLNIVSPVVLDFYNSLSDEDKIGFLETWFGIDDYTGKILDDFYSVSNLLEDAGDLDSAKELVNTPGIKEKWERMRKGIAAVLPDELPETEESENAAASASKTEAEAETVYETDKYGYYILGTDANGVTIYATDRNGNLISNNSDVKLTIDEYGRVIRMSGGKEKESEVETTETIESLPAPEPTTQAVTQPESQQETSAAIGPAVPIVPEPGPGYPTVGTDAVIFSDFH